MALSIVLLCCFSAVNASENVSSSAIEVSDNASGDNEVLEEDFSAKTLTDNSMEQIESANGNGNVLTSQSSNQNSATKNTNGNSNAKSKIKPTLTAKKATFKAKSKIKKYSITLKDGKKPIKKVKITLKIGKKTFKAKTNNKGKATFKIKKLTKKGTYKATIKFNGNKRYNAVTKKLKIKTR